MVRTMLDVVSGHMGLYMSIFINVHSETLTKLLAHELQGFGVTKMLFYSIYYNSLQTRGNMYTWHLLHQPRISHVSHTNLALFHLQALPPSTTIVVWPHCANAMSFHESTTRLTVWPWVSIHIFVCSPFSRWNRCPSEEEGTRWLPLSVQVWRQQRRRQTCAGVDILLRVWCTLFADCCRCSLLILLVVWFC